jgi:hypothetical protein
LSLVFMRTRFRRNPEVRGLPDDVKQALREFELWPGRRDWFGVVLLDDLA